MVSGFNPGGNKPDESTIGFNENDLLSVKKPKQTVLGSFNNGLDNFLLTSGSSSNVSISNTQVKIGSNSLKLDSGGIVEFGYEVDMTDLTHVSFWVYHDGSMLAGISTNNTVNSNLDNQRYENGNNVPQNEWVKLTFYVGDLTGNYYITLAINNGTTYYDQVKTIAENKVTGSNVV